MRIVLQRVTRASVRAEGVVQAAIGPGLLLLVGVERGDTEGVVDRLAEKVANLRVFAAEAGVNERMERSVKDLGGEILAVSQFTLAGSVRKGTRPSFDGAAPPGEAEPIYARFVAALRGRGLKVETGTFRAMMEVELVNSGPVTFVLEQSP
ncbi:MAG TPA: D-aminoacyl-tRNA deacylase [Candidatus Polarisedimenticolia bacterium]|jgi:D-tyrosyl-tRNA(Tyr) deacylase